MECFASCDPVKSGWGIPYDDDEDDAAGEFLDIYVHDSEPDNDDDEGLYV